MVPAGCLGSTSAIQSDPLGCEGNGRESIMGCMCLQKDVCGCDSSGSPGEAPWGHVSTTWAPTPAEPQRELLKYRIPGPGPHPHSQIAKVGIQDSVVSLSPTDTSGEPPRHFWGATRLGDIKQSPKGGMQRKGWFREDGEGGPSTGRTRKLCLQEI